MKNNAVEITRQLISIPSFVDEGNDEKAVGQFIFDYLKENSKLKVKKQILSSGRFNIIAANSDIADLLIVGHIDTVQPSKSWTKNPLNPEVSNGLLYGLGSSDMKSGVASMLELACSSQLKANTMFLFYIDEEYDFLGMKSFVKKFRKKIQPKQIISFDGSDLAITNGCRGLIEVTIAISGRSGHAARPESGINAINKSYQIITNLTNWLGNYVSQELGNTSSNLAYISGGGKQGNIIPDYCQFILDIRPSRPELTAKKVISFIRSEAKKLKVKVVEVSIRHDLGSWLTPKPDIDLGSQKLPFKSAGKTGYIDVQMLWKTFNQVPCFTIGAGNSMAHKPDEYVEIKNITKLTETGKKLLIK